MDRRAFLRVTGAAIALPALETFAPRALAADPLPSRLVCVFVPNGVHLPAWKPAPGPILELSPTLAPLAPFRERVIAFSGLALDGGRPHGDGPGDHARAAGSFLTAAHPVKTAGADIRAGVSLDQLVAMRLGRATRFPSLELGTESGRLGGSCDSGYSCAYSSTVCWKSPTQPIPHEVSPRQVFERLFGDPEAKKLSPEEAARRARQRRSVLDLVKEEARALQARLSRSDRSRVEEYLEGLREVERRIEKAETDQEAPDAIEPPAHGVPKSLAEHARLLQDLIVLAFKSDSTRVVTLMLGNAGSNRSHRDVGAPEGHHDLSHHGRDPEKQAKLAKINLHHVELFTHLLAGLSAAQEGEGTLLDRSLVLYGSGLGDGDAHNHDDLPILLAGGQALGVVGGRHVAQAEETPLANLYLAMLHRLGVSAPSFGDATGPLGSLA